MQIKFTLHAARLDHFKNQPEVIISDAELIEDSDGEMYRVTFEFPDYMSVGMICHYFFYTGVTYGLDLNYSSYDNEPARVR